MKSIGEISVSDAQRAGFREFSSCESGRKRSRRRLSIATRRESRDRLRPAPAHRMDGRTTMRDRAQL
ncbi:MAG: hypothetical protein E5W97_30110 [Mesorhizobium sp.]|nr:MAG: hypothetical protein E5W97_30110 [Mesorhizobium sp.]